MIHPPDRRLKLNGDSLMAENHRPDLRFEPKYCAFLRQHVWAILTEQSGGGWRIVNCLDKDEPCFGLNCAFTASDGEWPYKASPAEQPQSVNPAPRINPAPSKRGGVDPRARPATPERAGGLLG